MSLTGLEYNSSQYPNLTLADFEAAIRAAFDAWENVANVTFTEVPNPDGSLGDADVDFDLEFSPLGGSTVGVARYSYRPGAADGDNINVITDVSINFDSTSTWLPIAGSGGVSLFAVAVHEIGHGLGLGHVDDTSEILNPYISTDVLGDGDIDGIQHIYGARENPVEPAPSAEPDLSVSQFALNSTRWRDGASVTASFVVENSGGQYALQTLSQVYLSTDATITASDILLGSGSYMNPISSGMGTEQSTTFTLNFDASGLQAGTYYVGAITDIENVVVESNETNNISNVITVVVVDRDISDDDVANDFNGDGNSDILWRKEGSGKTGFWDVESGSVDWNYLASPSDGWNVVGSGDYNGDGIDDILWRKEGSGRTGYWDVASGSPEFEYLDNPSSAWDVVGGSVNELEI